MPHLKYFDLHEAATALSCNGMELTRLKRERAMDAVYQALRQAIVGSQMKPGERLNVDELAGKLGVSLTPIRHAIQQLSTEGLVEIRPRSGTFVANLSARDVAETFDIRFALERLAAERTVEQLTPLIIKKFRDLLKALRRPVRTAADREQHEADNADFHRLLIEASGNRRLVEMYETLNAHIRIARIHAGEENWPARAHDEEQEHEAIVRALEDRDAAVLLDALRRHIFRARDSLMASLTSLES